MHQLAQIVKGNVLSSTVNHESAQLIVGDVNGSSTRNLLALGSHLQYALYAPACSHFVLGGKYNAILGYL